MTSKMDRRIANNICLVTVQTIRRCYVSYIYTRIDEGYATRILGLVDTTGESGYFESLAYQSYKVAQWIGNVGYMVVYDTLTRLRDNILEDLRTTGRCVVNDLFRITRDGDKYAVKASKHIKRELGEGHRMKLARAYLVGLERSHVDTTGIDSADNMDAFEKLFGDNTLNDWLADDSDALPSATPARKLSGVNSL